MKKYWIYLLLISSIFSYTPTFANNEIAIVETTPALGTDISATLGSSYAYVIDYSNGQILLDKSSEERIYPASMTKLMTALLFVENVTDWSQTVTITEEMLAGLQEANASCVGYNVGDAPDFLSVLNGILLPSGADAVNAAAFVVSGSVEAFVQKMNEKAQELGMTGTNFVNPTGLHDDNHYSTCRDIAILLENCIQNETLRNTMQTDTYTDNLGYVMKNSWKSLQEYSATSTPGLLGGKTGYTLEAVNCFASFGEVNGMKIIAVTDHAEETAGNLIDASTIYNWLTNDYSRKVALLGETCVKSVTLEHVFGTEEIDVSAPTTIEMDIENSSVITITCDIPDTIKVEDYEQTYDGNITIFENGNVLTTISVQLVVPKEANIIASIVRKIQNLMGQK